MLVVAAAETEATVLAAPDTLDEADEADAETAASAVVDDAGTEMVDTDPAAEAAEDEAEPVDPLVLLPLPLLLLLPPTSIPVPADQVSRATGSW